MDFVELKNIFLYLQAGGLGIIVALTTKILRKLKLYEMKQEALIYAIKRESYNGFAEAYEEKLKELMNEQKFLRY